MTHRKPKITLGVELETYSIAIPDNRICRELQFPKRSAIEKGERFTRDWSIGSEFNSKAFTNIRQAFFLLKSSLRKYTKFSEDDDPKDRLVIFPVGGWTDRFAGCHIHLAKGPKGIEYDDAKKLAEYLHDQIPFLIALSANSPVWREKITGEASNRMLLGTKKYFRVSKRGTLSKVHFRELNFNRGGKKKPDTLEFRGCDSSVPEFVVACLSVCYAVALKWLKKETIPNRSTHVNYLRAREQAIKFGPKARLVWANHWMSVPNYVDLFFRKYEDELRAIDLPQEILDIFKYLKKGWNQSEVIRCASEKCRRRHRPTWQRQFAKRYALAIEELLDGNSFEQFAKRLGVRLPNIDRTWLGRKEAIW